MILNSALIAATLGCTAVTALISVAVIKQLEGANTWFYAGLVLAPAWWYLGALWGDVILRSLKLC